MQYGWTDVVDLVWRQYRSSFAKLLYFTIDSWTRRCNLGWAEKFLWLAVAQSLHAAMKQISLGTFFGPFFTVEKKR